MSIDGVLARILFAFFHSLYNLALSIPPGDPSPGAARVRDGEGALRGHVFVWRAGDAPVWGHDLVPRAQTRRHPVRERQLRSAQLQRPDVSHAPFASSEDMSMNERVKNYEHFNDCASSFFARYCFRCGEAGVTM